MTKNSTDSNNGFLKKVSSNSTCYQCLQNLSLMIDGEATNEQEVFFKKHIDECIPCLDSYNVEKSVKEFLQKKIENKPIPSTLIENIKNKIALML